MSCLAKRRASKRSYLPNAVFGANLRAPHRLLQTPAENIVSPRSLLQWRRDGKFLGRPQAWRSTPADGRDQQVEPALSENQSSSASVRCAVLRWPPPCVAVSASAQDVKDRMASALSRFAGQPIAVEAVRPSPAPGIVEVQIQNGPLLYATADGDYFFLNGDLHQISTSGAVNLTEERRSVAGKNNWRLSRWTIWWCSHPRERCVITSRYSPMSPAFTAKSCTVRWISSMRKVSRFVTWPFLGVV